MQGLAHCYFQRHKLGYVQTVQFTGSKQTAQEIAGTTISVLQQPIIGVDFAFLQVINPLALLLRQIDGRNAGITTMRDSESMAEQKEDKLYITIGWRTRREDISALEAICSRMLSDSQKKTSHSRAVRELLRGVARGELAIVAIGNDDSLERGIKTMRYVRKTLGTINPELASPLYRIHAGLTLCKQLRQDYVKRKNKIKQ